jgi:hypothetical protein
VRLNKIATAVANMADALSAADYRRRNPCGRDRRASSAIPGGDCLPVLQANAFLAAGFDFEKTFRVPKAMEGLVGFQRVSRR